MVATTLLGLDALNFELVFVDEFWVNNDTYTRYNWAAKGEAAVIPL